MRKLLGTVLAMTLALSGAAAAEVLKCTMKVGRSNQGDMISKEVYLIHDPAAKSMMVLDNIIAHYNKEKPIEARITTEKPASRKFDWAVHMVNDAGQRTRMQYHASLFLATSELHVMARPVGYSNTISATGKCAPHNG